jgi:hypothetical protein
VKCAEPDGTMAPRLADREKGARAQLTDLVSGRCAL